MDIDYRNSQSIMNIEDLRKKSINRLKRIDNKSIIDANGEIRLFAIMRNESLRLPHFIEYYRKLGVDRFFFIDNNSTDNSVEIIREQDNIHLFSTHDNYKNHWFWMEYLLETYGKKFWCLVVDIDELFSFPHVEYLSIKDLINYLEVVERSTAIISFLLDMYSNESLKSIKYQQGNNPLDVLNFFDCDYNIMYSKFVDQKASKLFYQKSFTGGMRVRVFGKTSNVNTLSKVSLFKYNPETYLHVGMHALNGCVMSKLQGVVFHTKFLSDFITEVEEESKREEHYNNAYFYKHYEKRLKKEKNISFFDASSIKYKDSKQLVNLGVTETTIDFDEFANSILIKKNAL